MRQTQILVAEMDNVLEGFVTVDPATAYLDPALSRDNLAIEVKAHVTRVVMDGLRAVGVDYVRDGRAATIDVRLGERPG